MRCLLLVVAGHMWKIVLTLASQVSKAKACSSRLGHEVLAHQSWDMRCSTLMVAGHRWSVVHVLASQVSKAKSLLIKARA
ncbi:hypothetical protein TIFTF001_029154 [Ficus carica]|uniref:Secreted protein n=1 Tax=Ficus carica TaxID=3494 RepID=A0AA88IXM5_FICCA|nr:hypothetical protein TIFTF001_029154 [Ficus carica]